VGFATHQKEAPFHGAHDSANWPCTKFVDSVISGDGTESHQTGYLSPDYQNGSVAVLSYMGTRNHVVGLINSDCRCPVGNRAVGDVSGSQHVEGTACDFDASCFNEVMWEYFEEAAMAAGASRTSGFAGGKLGNERGNWNYRGYIHIYCEVMKQILGRYFIQALLLLAFPAVSTAQERAPLPPMTEQAAAAALAEGQLTPERERALGLDLGARAGPELRGAVIDAAWAELRGETDRPKESEAVFVYMDAVARLGDPRAIPFLIEVLGNGPGAWNALADLAPGSFPAVLEVVSNPEEDPSDVGGGLMALKFMLEDRVLTAGQTDQVRDVVRARLSGSHHVTVVDATLRLALALSDPELRGIVERFADDRGFAETLMSPYLASGNPREAASHARLVNTYQKRARTFLDGGGADIGPFRRRMAVEIH
jgi:hypothetical protein